LAFHPHLSLLPPARKTPCPTNFFLLQVMARSTSLVLPQSISSRCPKSAQPVWILRLFIFFSTASLSGRVRVPPKTAGANFRRCASRSLIACQSPFSCFVTLSWFPPDMVTFLDSIILFQLFMSAPTPLSPFFPLLLLTRYSLDPPILLCFRCCPFSKTTSRFIFPPAHSPNPALPSQEVRTFPPLPSREVFTDVVGDPAPPRVTKPASPPFSRPEKRLF